jgi:peptidoglycan/xylan/chitin deacetylase (PgdA/CDA1 family)
VEVNQELVLRMDQEGHQIGVHSYHHKLLTELSAADFYEEVGALRNLISSIIGHDDLVLRPPYGKADASVKNLAGCPIIQWSIDPEDWSDTDTARQVEHIVSRAQDGDIILLHDIYPSSVDTALQVVDALLADGFYFVTIDELFAAKGIELKDGQVYSCAKDTFSDQKKYQKEL